MNAFSTAWLFILLITLIGGAFAAAEIALVSLREGQLKRLTERGGRRADQLRRLSEDPNRFLAAVQVGVTLTGFLSAGFGASQIAPQVAPALDDWGLPAADSIAFIGVTIVIAFISLVLGELVPKRLGLQRAESVAMALVTPLSVVAVLARPFIWLLSHTTNLVVRLIGLDPSLGRESMSGEELRGLVASHADLTAEERELIDEVFEAGDRELREVMVPRTEVAFLDHDMPVFKAAKEVAEQPHSRYPVTRDSQDDIVGFVHVRDLLDPSVVERSIRVGDLARPLPMFPGTKQVIPALSEMRRLGHHMAVVADEYGGTAGIITMEDLVEELIGDIRDEYDIAPGPSLPMRIGEVVLDGLVNLEDFADQTGVELPEGPYETVAGYCVAHLGRLPEVGDRIEVDGAVVIIEELDGRRISRVRVVLNSVSG